MSKSILGIILSLFLSLSLRAEQPIFTISSTEANPGQIIDIDIHVDNFTDLIVVQYSVNWDPTVLKYRALKNFNPSVPGLNPSVFGTEAMQTDAGQLTLGWLESSITPITIPDSSLFFTIEFEVIGEPCESSAISITGTPLEIEVAEEGEVQVGLVSNNGNVNIPGTGCSADVLFIGNSVIGPCGGNTCIQFAVENFTDVGAMQFALEYDPTVLQFDEFRNYGPLPGFGPGNTNLNQPGELRVVWTHPNAENASLADGTVLFEICFDVIGSGGQFSDITFGDSFLLLVSDIDGNEYNVDITPARITAQCALEGFALIADTFCTMPNTTHCMDIRVNDFDNIVAVQLSMNWDSTVFEFDHVEGFGLPGLDAGYFGTPDDLDVDEGELTMSWFDVSLAGVTVPDLSTIFTLCLKTRGAAGTSSPITFSANPLDIEVLNAEDSVLVYALIQGRGEIKASCEGCSVSYTLTTTSPECPREASGSINLTVTEDCPETPTFMWSTGATTEDISGVAAGTYTVTITVGSQVVIATGTVTDPPGMGASWTFVNPDPIGSSNGSINLTVTGGTPPYTYQWAPNGSTLEDLVNIPCGTYTVTVTDSKGCVFIPDPIILCADVAGAITHVSCFGGNDGAINLSVTFGTGPYTYTWNTVPPSTTEDLANLKAGSYCVTITDNGGSTRDTCFTVTQAPALNVTASITHDVNENCMGAIDLNVTGGTMPYSYAWSTGAVSQDITQRCVGQYCVTITDGEGCAFDTCFSVAGEGISVTLTALQYGNFQTSCPGICDGDITSVVAGGGNNVTYAWSTGATTADLNDVCAGTYSVTVTDETGRTATATIIITSPPPFTFAYIKTNPTDFITSNGAISVVVNGGFPPYTLLWDGPGSVTGTTAALNNVPAGTYTLNVTDSNGCTARDAEQLLPDVDVPCYTAMKIFTPNSDDKNDLFIITCVYDFDNHLSIFNRAGALVYETDDYQNTWDGVDGDGEALPDGGYLWVLEIFRPEGTTQLVKGTVNLLRTAD